MGGDRAPVRLEPMNSTDVQTTLRDMWETRPARPRHDRKVAGVAAAIARRYDIDPVLVRVGFVVAAFYGIGAALYIAGWVLLPDARDGDPGDGTGARRRPHPLLLVGLVVAAVDGIATMFDRHGGVVLPALAALGLLFLLHRSRGDRVRGVHRPAVTPAGAVVDPPATGVTPPVAPWSAVDPPAHPGEPRAVPPSWDPLGAAPFAWDLPEPTVGPVAGPVRRRSRVTPLTLAIALLTGGVLGSLLLLGYGVTTLPVLFGIVLAILGAGLVVGAFLHAGRGLVPIALLMCLLTGAAVAAPVDALRGGVGETRAAPRTVAELAPEYHRGAGSVVLDLSELDLAAPPGTDPALAGPVRVAASVGMGRIDVVVPPDADLTVHGTAGTGRVGYGTRQSDGPGAELSVVDDLGADGIRSGRSIVLDLNAGLGDVQVRRG